MDARVKSSLLTLSFINDIPVAIKPPASGLKAPVIPTNAPVIIPCPMFPPVETALSAPAIPPVAAPVTARAAIATPLNDPKEATVIAIDAVINNPPNSQPNHSGICPLGSA